MSEEMRNPKKTYTIKEMAKLVGIESHVLRYWEEELDIRIERNELGHRTYTEEDVRLFCEVKRLKDGGIALKAIRRMLREIQDQPEESEELKSIREVAGTYAGAALTLPAQEENDERVEWKDEGNENTENTEKEHGQEKQDECYPVSEKESGRVVDFKMAQLQAILNRAVKTALTETMKESMKAIVSETVVKQVDMLLREQEEREEKRFRKLDEQLRAMQKPKKRRLFKK